MIEICRSHLVAAFPSAMDCLYFCSVREYMDVSWLFCVWWKQNKNGLNCQKWLRPSRTQPILAVSDSVAILSPFDRFFPAREAIPWIHQSRCDVRKGKQMLFWGRNVVLLSGTTRTACFPEYDVGFTDVYRFPRGRAHTCGKWSQDC